MPEATNMGGIVLIGDTQASRVPDESDARVDSGRDERTRLTNSIEWWVTASEVILTLSQHLGTQTVVAISGPATMQITRPDGLGTKGMRLETLLKKLTAVRVNSAAEARVLMPGTWQYYMLKFPSVERLPRHLETSHQWLWERHAQLLADSPQIVIDTSGRLLQVPKDGSSPQPSSPRPRRTDIMTRFAPKTDSSLTVRLTAPEDDERDAREMAAIDFLHQSADTWILLPDTPTERRLIQAAYPELSTDEPTAGRPLPGPENAEWPAMGITAWLMHGEWQDATVANAALREIHDHPDDGLDFFDLLATPGLLALTTHPSRPAAAPPLPPMVNCALTLRERLANSPDFEVHRQGSGVLLLLTDAGDRPEVQGTSIGALVDRDAEGVRFRLVYDSDARDRMLLLAHRQELQQDFRAWVPPQARETGAFRPTTPLTTSEDEAAWAVALATRVRRILLPLDEAVRVMRSSGDVRPLVQLARRPNLTHAVGTPCAKAGCHRRAMITTRSCLAHSTPSDAFDWGELIQKEMKKSEFLDASNMRLDEQLAYGLQWCAHDAAGPSFLDLAGSTIVGDLTINGPCEELTVTLDHATIQGTLHLYHPSMGDLILTDATVHGDIEGTVWGKGGLYGAGVSVGGSIEGQFSFPGVHLGGCHVRGDVTLKDLFYRGLVLLPDARIGGTLTLPEGQVWSPEQPAFAEGAQVRQVRGRPPAGLVG